MADLARLRLFVTEPEGEREPARERAPAQVEHPRALNTTIADQRDVCCASADVDENSALFPGLFAGASARQRVRLGDGRGKLEVQLPDNALECVDVGNWSEGVENGELQILTRETDGIGDGVAIHSHVGDRGVHEPSLQLAVTPLEFQEVLRLTQGAALNHLKHVLDLRRAHSRLGVVARVRNRRRKTFDKLAGDANDDLSRHGRSHILGRLERAVACLNDRFEICDRPA